MWQVSPEGKASSRQGVAVACKKLGQRELRWRTNNPLAGLMLGLGEERSYGYLV
jgi:hypothetical protein